MTGPPVVPGRLYGLRRWRVEWDEHPPALDGWGVGGRWSDGDKPTKARCVSNRVPRHRAPHAGCSCGLYGLHPTVSVSRDLRRDAAGDATVVGIIEAWGRVELHHDGFRAEYARPHAFVHFKSVADPAHEARTRAVAKAHGVPVLRVDGARSLYEHCVDRGLGMSMETVRELLLPTAPTRPPQRTRPLPRRSIGNGLADAIGVIVLGAVGLAYAAFWLLVVGAGVLIAIDLIEGDDAPALAIGDNRYLRVHEQAVVPLEDGEAIYVARLTNTHPRRTALGVFARGEFLDADGLEAGEPDPRFEIEQRPTLAPGQTGVMVDFIEGATWAEDVAGFDVDFRARGFEVGARRPVARVGTVRLDRRRCLLTAELTSRRRLRALDVPVIGRDARRTIDGAGLFVAGPVPRGRSLQVLERIDPELCSEGLLGLEGYASPRPGQLR